MVLAMPIMAMCYPMITQFQPMVDCVSMVVALWFYRRIL